MPVNTWMGPSAPHGCGMWLVEDKPFHQKLILSLGEEAVLLPCLFRGLSDGQREDSHGMGPPGLGSGLFSLLALSTACVLLEHPSPKGHVHAGPQSWTQWNHQQLGYGWNKKVFFPFLSLLLVLFYVFFAPVREEEGTRSLFSLGSLRRKMSVVCWVVPAACSG